MPFPLLVYGAIAAVSIVGGWFTYENRKQAAAEAVSEASRAVSDATPNLALYALGALGALFIAKLVMNEMGRVKL